MRKGEATRHNILSCAIRMASACGLEGLSIGSLAHRLSLSKSGLFAHFRSKEALQKQVLDAYASLFTEAVIKPAVKAPRGLPRVRALFDRWLEWGGSRQLPGGCLFIAASIELDDRPGPVRDHLVKLQQEWRETRVRILRTAIEAGHFRADTDAEQLAHDLFGIIMACHYALRLLKDPDAITKSRRAFETLLSAVKTPEAKDL